MLEFMAVRQITVHEKLQSNIHPLHAAKLSGHKNLRAWIHI